MRTDKILQVTTKSPVMKAETLRPSDHYRTEAAESSEVLSCKTGNSL